ncbi:taste receptor type 2 member 4 [Hippopotamus amphibius kiboko]|uniref:taste receptor type 2 member 4 n=1 Tax=Hippopotamus amphibius kiboko TaxID=575201 RepID=UPI0025996AD1|nr:taste receptor type 2 member 4 [Hippopotamus amphibius kiboko]
MVQTYFVSSIIVSAVLTFVGLIVNLFIVVVNYKTWVKSHRVSSSDRLLFSLSLTRFLILGLNAIFLISPNMGRSVYLSTFFLSCWMFLNSNSLWFVTLLNVLYCVKIANYQHSVFLLLKRNLSSKMPRLLLVCMLISAFTTLLYVVLRQIAPPSEFVTGRNGTIFDINEGISSVVTPLILSSFLQFIINVTSASLLINSLRRHIQKMQRNATVLWNPQTEAHVGAVKLMIYFLLLYIPYSVATLLHYLPSSLGMDLGAKSSYVIISAIYPPGHSVLIILTHPKLKTEAKKILCFSK